MPKKVRVHELAKELGLTNKEALDLCIALGIDAKSHSSSIEDTQGDRVRRRAHKDGLVREHQPEEPAPVKRTTKKAAATTKKAAAAAEPPAEGGGVAVVVEDAPLTRAEPEPEVVPTVPAPSAPVERAPVTRAPEVAAAAPTGTVAPVVEPEVQAVPAARPAPAPEAEAPPVPHAAPAPVEQPAAAAAAPEAETVVERPAEDGEHRIISSRQAVEPERPIARRPEGPPPGAASRAPAPAPAARPAAPARPATPGARPVPRPRGVPCRPAASPSRRRRVG